jgi:hypothetical protein
VNAHLRIGVCLSLSGKFAQFGRQAALGLEAWRSLDGAADLVIEDDRSDRRTLEAVLTDEVLSRAFELSIQVRTQDGRTWARLRD